MGAPARRLEGDVQGGKKERGEHVVTEAKANVQGGRSERPVLTLLP